MVDGSPGADLRQVALDQGLQLLEELCGDYLPDTCFDIHAHLYRRGDGNDSLPQLLAGAERNIGFDDWKGSLHAWMGHRVPNAGLFFAYPKADLDISSANDYVLSQLGPSSDSRALLLVSPSSNPESIEQQILDCHPKIAGFKVYHCYATRRDTQQAEIGEFLPTWVWSLADKYSLAIMLHIVKPHALADVTNQAYLRTHCETYFNAKLILAHAARGFCADHTVRGIRSLAGLNNVYFDTSAVCESPALDAVLRIFGPRRLLFGTDFPVSDILGRAVSIGDQFVWLDESVIQTCSDGRVKPWLVGMESLKALLTTFRNLQLSSNDAELVMNGNARRLLNLDQSSDSKTGARYQQAKQRIPGGTQLLSKRPEMYAPQVWPAYFAEARGCEVVDLDGRKYIDFATSGIGSCLLGFADPDVNRDVVRRVQLGSMCSLNAPEEVDLAERLLEIHPWADSARFTRTGGEANAVAIRVARAATDRDMVAFCGYHGWSDWYLATNLEKSGSVESHRVDRLGSHLLPGLDPAGVPKGLAGTALPFNYNQADELEQIIAQEGDRLAAVVMEPFRFTEPEPGFLPRVRELCDACGAVLIFDEITSGWRFAVGGIHLHFGVAPDMAVFAKSMSNGFPMGAIIGRQDVMEFFQKTFVSSTYWTESVGPVAALATIDKLSDHFVHEHIAAIGGEFRSRLLQIAQSQGVGLRISGRDSLQHIQFQGGQSNAVSTLFTVEMLKRGFLSGSGFYPTYAHSTTLIDQYCRQAAEAMKVVAKAIESDQVDSMLPGGPRQTGFARLVK